MLTLYKRRMRKMVTTERNFMKIAKHKAINLRHAGSQYNRVIYLRLFFLYTF